MAIKIALGILFIILIFYIRTNFKVTSIFEASNEQTFPTFLPDEKLIADTFGNYTRAIFENNPSFD